MKHLTLTIIALLGIAMFSSCVEDTTQDTLPTDGRNIRARLISETVETIVPVYLNAGELKVYKYRDTVHVGLSESTGTYFILSTPADDNSIIAVLEKP